MIIISGATNKSNYGLIPFLPWNGINYVYKFNQLLPYN